MIEKIEEGVGVIIGPTPIFIAGKTKEEGRDE